MLMLVPSPDPALPGLIAWQLLEVCCASLELATASLKRATSRYYFFFLVLGHLTDRNHSTATGTPKDMRLLFAPRTLILGYVATCSIPELIMLPVHTSTWLVVFRLKK